MRVRNELNSKPDGIRADMLALLGRGRESDHAKSNVMSH
jgi:hypothetical protein